MEELMACAVIIGFGLLVFWFGALSSTSTPEQFHKASALCEHHGGLKAWKSGTIYCEKIKMDWPDEAKE